MKPDSLTKILIAKRKPDSLTRITFLAACKVNNRAFIDSFKKITLQRFAPEDNLVFESLKPLELRFEDSLKTHLPIDSIVFEHLPGILCESSDRTRIDELVGTIHWSYELNIFVSNWPRRFLREKYAAKIAGKFWEYIRPKLSYYYYDDLNVSLFEDSKRDTGQIFTFWLWGKEPLKNVNNYDQGPHRPNPDKELEGYWFHHPLD